MTEALSSLKSVLILGLGESGLACAQWFTRAGAKVRVADTREAAPGLKQLLADCPTAEFVAGAFDLSLLEGIDSVIRSPGLAPPELKALRDACIEREISWLCELDIFTRALEALKVEKGYAPKVVAVTGTNGKTTVTQLATMLAARAGTSAIAAGNVSPAMLTALASALQTDTLPQLWVLELSSFQLDGVEGFDPSAAVVLNISQDHLDWHGNMDAYAHAKGKVYGRSTARVANRHDDVVLDLAKFHLPKDSRIASFGADLPRVPGDFGIERVGGLDWLVLAVGDDLPRRKKSEPQDFTLKRLMPVDALLIRGRHNALNALAALALLSAVGLPLAGMLRGLREYRGEPHRVESVATIQGVEYFDDSKGTNVGATVAALTGLQRTVVLIAGGLGKGQDFGPLAVPVAAHARAVILIGQDASAIELALQETGVPIVPAQTLEEAVAKAAGLAQSGDVVLLSPACSSLDMFKNYGHRAQVFVDAVRSLAADHGEVIA
jgi:UDP-N-acetylmuramoylalanine--D-glutamate ligase